MAEFTKGPWEAHQAAVKGPITRTGRMSYIAVCRVPQTVDREIMLANARLIAAAPELYEALKALYRFQDGPDDPAGSVRVLHLAEAALAKAVGK